MKYRLTPAALSDIRQIVWHVRTIQKSPQNARLVAERLKHQFQKLARMPGLGHPRPELEDDDALVIAVTGLLVIYDAKLRPLTILRVIHGGRDLGKIDPRGSAD